MRMTWDEAVIRFKIGKVHQNACLDEVAKVYKAIGQEGISWITSNPKPSLYLSGNAGSGKSFFMYALLRAIIKIGCDKASVLLVRSDELDNELLKAIKNDNEEWVLEKYHDVAYLFIDDLGVERVSERIIKQYYSIIDRRMNNLLPTIFTSNLPLEKINTTLGDRIASRLEMSTEIKFPKCDLRREPL